MLTPVRAKPCRGCLIAGTSTARAEATVGAAALVVQTEMMLSLSVKKTAVGEMVRAQPSGTLTSYWPEPGRKAT